MDPLGKVVSAGYVVDVQDLGRPSAKRKHGVPTPPSYNRYMGNCQNYGPFLGPYYNTGPNTGPNLGDPKRDHNFDNPPYSRLLGEELLLIRCNQVFSFDVAVRRTSARTPGW